MKNIFKNAFNILYLILIILICFTYITIDYKTRYDSSAVKLSLVILVAIYVFIHALKYITKKKDMKINVFYILAISFTLTSDVFLLIIDDYYHIALTTFIIAHLSYSFAIYYLDDKRSQKRLIIEKSLILVIGIITFIITKESLAFLASIYACLLVMNFINSLILFIKTKTYYALLLTIGFILFIGCDICVLLSNLYQFVDETNEIIKIENKAECIIWIFYGPSQYFLGLSINRGDNNEE